MASVARSNAFGIVQLEAINLGSECSTPPNCRAVPRAAVGKLHLHVGHGKAHAWVRAFNAQAAGEFVLAIQILARAHEQPN